jgi:hypothetical protein
VFVEDRVRARAALGQDRRDIIIGAPGLGDKLEVSEAGAPEERLYRLNVKYRSPPIIEEAPPSRKP